MDLCWEWWLIPIISANQGGRNQEDMVSGHPTEIVSETPSQQISWAWWILYVILGNKMIIVSA
jgi:hypothetical protein